MKLIFFVFATVLVFAQSPIKPQKVPPLPADELNQNFLKTCDEGEKIFAKIQNKAASRGELDALGHEFIELVIKLDYTMIRELGIRTKKEIEVLEKSRKCTEALTAKMMFYIKRNRPRTLKPEKVWQ